MAHREIRSPCRELFLLLLPRGRRLAAAATGPIVPRDATGRLYCCAGLWFFGECICCRAERQGQGQCARTNGKDRDACFHGVFPRASPMIRYRGRVAWQRYDTSMGSIKAEKVHGLGHLFGLLKLIHGTSRFCRSPPPSPNGEREPAVLVAPHYSHTNRTLCILPALAYRARRTASSKGRDR
jgi:hypothetical protein